MPAVQVVIPSTPDQQDSFDGDVDHTSASGPSGGGSGGKIDVHDITISKLTNSANATGDLSGTTGGEDVEAALLLPAVQQVREAAMSEAAGSESHTIETMDTWADFFLG